MQFVAGFLGGWLVGCGAVRGGKNRGAREDNGGQLGGNRLCHHRRERSQAGLGSRETVSDETRAGCSSR